MTPILMPKLSEAAKLISDFEGFKASPYLDTAGIATIGFGSTHYPDGRAVSMKDPTVLPVEALTYLEHDLTDTALHLWKFVKIQPTLNQWSAMLSLAYNIGWFAISRSTLLADFNSAQTASAANQFIVWDKDHRDGQLVIVPGLLNRRLAEQKLFLTAD